MVFFAKDFLLALHDIIILTFPENIIFYYHAAIPEDIELKVNVYKTSVRSVYVCFQQDYKGPQNLCY